MHGERFEPNLEPLGNDLRNVEVTKTFGIAAAPHSDEEHSVFALVSIMNAFPQAVARNGVPLPIKCDIIKPKPGIEPSPGRLGLAYATRRNKCYWILFSEEFIKSCASNAKVFASSIKALEPSLFKGVKEEHLLALVRDMTMEIVVQHELCHVIQGHVDYASQYGPIGVVEPTTRASLSDRYLAEINRQKFRQRSMEFVADEAGIGSATLRSGLGNWMLVDRSAKEYFDTATLSLAAYIGMLAFTIEASGIDSNDRYPSKAARTFRFHNVFCGYVHQAVTEPGLQYRVDPNDLVDKAHLCLDVINEAADRGLLGHRDAHFKAAVASFFSAQAREKAQRECDDIAQECREDIPKWAPFRGQYITWQDYVAYERQNGRNPIGVGR